jgi:hypothetical protein
MTSRGARVYIAAVVAAGTAVLGWLLELAHRRLGSLHFVGVSILASGMKVTLSAGAGTMSMNFLFILIGVNRSAWERPCSWASRILVQRFLRQIRNPRQFRPYSTSPALRAPSDRRLPYIVSV